MPKWSPYQQGSAAWLKARSGCLTASRMSDAMAFNSKGAETAARRKYKLELIAERLSDTLTEKYVNTAMQHGTETEPMARTAYEEITGRLVEECGFALHDTIQYCGASPDGLVGADGLLEIKCPSSITHLDWMLAGTVPEQHKPQMLLQLAVTDRKWCDFVSYDPRLADSVAFFSKRFEPAPEEIAAVETAAGQFLAEVEEMYNQITGGANA